MEATAEIPAIAADPAPSQVDRGRHAASLEKSPSHVHYPAAAATAAGGISDASTSPPTTWTPDLVGTPPLNDPQLERFLAASEPQPDDDVREKRAFPRPSPKTARALIRMGVIVLIAALAAVLLRTFVVSPYYIPSESMEPTLHGCSGCNNDHVLVDKLSYRLHSPHQGDIVVFHRPKSISAQEIPDSVLIKRVIGLPGDKVTLRGGQVYINDLLLHESYVDHKKCGNNPSVPGPSGTTSWLVPSNDVFVMGDHRCDSVDSRYFGPISESSIIGRAFMIIYPFNRIRLL